ncbi:putative TIM-barrel fold metal-dependent hydrolase [Kocuria marina]
MRYEFGAELAQRDGIDVHVHIECSDHGYASLPAALTEASAKHFKSEDRSPTLDTIAERYREWNLAAVVFTVDAATALGHEPNSIATHKANVWIELSGWSPTYFPESLVHASNAMLQDKVLFGTDYPLITPQKWLGAFEQQRFKDEVKLKILKGNALWLFGLGELEGTYEPSESGVVVAAKKYAAEKAAQRQKVERA